MNTLHSINYHHLGKNGTLALYLIYLCYQKGKSGIHLSNKCLRQLLNSPCRVYQTKIDTFSKSVEYLFPYAEVVRWENNSHSLILGRCEEAIRNHHKIDEIPNETEIMKTLGFSAHKLEIK